MRTVTRDEYFAGREGLEILRPATQYRREPARVLNPELALPKTRRRYERSLEQSLPSEGVALFHDAILYGKGRIVTAEGLLLAESLETHRDPVPAPPSGDPAATFETAVSVIKRGSRNYGHFLVEMLPRLVLNAGHYPADAPILLHRDSERFALPMLSAAGIAADRVAWIGDDPVAVRDLVWPTRNCFGRLANSPYVFPFLRELAERLGGGATPSRRLFVSRRDAATRRLTNDDEVFAALEPHGFELVSPGHLPFEEQVATFAQAEAVVGIGGAALTNTAFMPPGGAVLMLGPRTMGGYLFWDISEHCDLTFAVLFGEIDGPPDLNAKNTAFALDPGTVAAAAREMLGDA